VPYGITQYYLPPGRGDIPVVVSLIVTLSTAKLRQFCRLKLYEIKYNISLNDVHMYMHSCNKTDKTISVTGAYPSS